MIMYIIMWIPRKIWWVICLPFVFVVWLFKTIINFVTFGKCFKPYEKYSEQYIERNRYLTCFKSLNPLTKQDLKDSLCVGEVIISIKKHLKSSIEDKEERGKLISSSIDSFRQSPAICEMIQLDPEEFDAVSEELQDVANVSVGKYRSWSGDRLSLIITGYSDTGGSGGREPIEAWLWFQPTAHCETNYTDVNKLGPTKDCKCQACQERRGNPTRSTMDFCEVIGEDDRCGECGYPIDECEC